MHHLDGFPLKENTGMFFFLFILTVINFTIPNSTIHYVQHYLLTLIAIHISLTASCIRYLWWYLQGMLKFVWHKNDIMILFTCLKICFKINVKQFSFVTNPRCDFVETQVERSFFELQYIISRNTFKTSFPSISLTAITSISFVSKPHLA